MFVAVFGSPLGLLGAILLDDRSRHIGWERTFWRLLVAAFGCAAAFFAILGLSSFWASEFLLNQGWIFFPLTAPLVAAILSEVAIRPPAINDVA